MDDPDTVFDADDAVSAGVGQGDDMLDGPVADSHFGQRLVFERSKPEVAGVKAVVLDAVRAAAVGQRVARNGLAAVWIDLQDLSHRLLGIAVPFWPPQFGGAVGGQPEAVFTPSHSAGVGGIAGDFADHFGDTVVVELAVAFDEHDSVGDLIDDPEAVIGHLEAVWHCVGGSKQLGVGSHDSPYGSWSRSGRGRCAHWIYCRSVGGGTPTASPLSTMRDQVLSSMGMPCSRRC